MTPNRSRSKRRYARLEADLPAEMAVSVVSTQYGEKKVTVPVTIKSVGPEGLGLATIGTVGLDLTRGKNIKVKFQVAKDDVEIPARIAWALQKPSGEKRIDLGVKLFLQMIPAKYRQTYANWFVTQFRHEAGLAKDN